MARKMFKIRLLESMRTQTLILLQGHEEIDKKTNVKVTVLSSACRIQKSAYPL